ncbi:PRTRC system protein C [Rugamonas aquatica]|uniref:PRTRC system protein C n=1 Tax=Rugamonas aquatica TaxID=2743357 RepID=A0A6A7N6A3_9BURK|nr:PRTRC system protein C [Rugamonas aquatica]MQA40566.1 PRTRC system protein C [Rugamonas aquatica]
MPIEIEATRRVLRYNGVTLTDLPGHTLEDMRKLHALQFPELLNADVELEPVVNGEQEVTFRRTVGTKQ